MATLKTKFMVGIFVIVGFSMAIIAVIWLGMSNYLEKGRYYVAYFDESVQGLDKDSPVKYRGVTIGSVNSIGVAPDANLIQVVLKIESDIQLDDSIVAQLKSVGITGIMYVELEKQLENAAVPDQQIEFPTPYPVISTKPSDIRKFFDTLTEILGTFSKLDLQEISNQLQSVMAKIEQAADDAQIDVLFADLQATLADIQTITTEKNWESAFESLNQAAQAFETFSKSGTQVIDGVGPTLDHFDKTLKENEASLRTLMAAINALVLHMDALVADGNRFLADTHKDTSRLLPQVRETLRRYEQAGKHLNRFLDRIAEQPSQLFLGRPPGESDQPR